MGGRGGMWEERGDRRVVSVQFSHACAATLTPQSLMGERKSAHLQNQN